MAGLLEWLEGLFGGGRSQEEKQLLNTYSRVLASTGLSRREAREQVKQAIEDCKQAAREEGTDEAPEDLGDRILERAEEGDEQASRIVERARKEGATDDDIRQWWNMSDLRRRMICWAEDACVRMPMYVTATRHGLSEEEAGEKVRQYFPVYGDPDDTEMGTGDDRPLPHELRDRVERYRREHRDEDRRSKLEGYSSYNALVRDEIRSGNL